MTPKISILLPNLNNRPYLDERMRTIMEQSVTDWELIIVDNYSDDGAWEFFQEWAQKDTRVNISQAPREGMYANWNNCIRLARGEYVYIATSDDSMAPNALEEMANALDQHPECDLAHCKLKIIDENGNPHHALNWDKFNCSAYFGDLIDQKHIRLAPHDGLLHCGVKTVYTSITQLLIRRSLFDRVGLFLTNFGSLADFEWDMRASLVANTIHIPQYLATWRVHPDQGTNMLFLNTSEYRTKLLEMMEHAFMSAKKIDSTLLSRIKIKELKHFYLKEKFIFEIKELKQKMNTKIYKFRISGEWLFHNPRILVEYFKYLKSMPKSCNSPRSFISPLEALEFSRKILAKYGLEKNCQIIDR